MHAAHWINEGLNRPQPPLRSTIPATHRDESHVEAGCDGTGPAATATASPARARRPTRHSRPISWCAMTPGQATSPKWMAASSRSVAKSNFTRASGKVHHDVGMHVRERAHARNEPASAERRQDGQVAAKASPERSCRRYSVATIGSGSMSIRRAVASCSCQALNAPAGRRTSTQPVPSCIGRARFPPRLRNGIAPVGASP
jgi:hypothetical protein